jgi:hypothetical protein
MNDPGNYGKWGQQHSGTPRKVSKNPKTAPTPTFDPPPKTLREWLDRGKPANRNSHIK